MPESNAIHIKDVDPSTIAEGELVEQGGEIYRVTSIRMSPVRSGIDSIYFEWTGSDQSDVFRSNVNHKGYAGQIRWEMPYRAEVAV